MRRRNRILYLLFLLPFSLPVLSQPVDFPGIFGENWANAESYVADNRPWIEPLLGRYEIDFNEAMAVVFPELVRYSALRDKVETTLLKALYINLGKEYANFSIGHFQMKPLFAEKIRESAAYAMGRRARSIVKDSSYYRNIREYRASVVADLEDPVRQVQYLVVFFSICSKSFSTGSMDDSTRIRFLSTAYNYGFYHTYSEIEEMTGRRFYSTKLFNSREYSYSDISYYWYSSRYKKR